MEHNQNVQSKSLKPKTYVSKLGQNLFKDRERWDNLMGIYRHYHWLFLFSLLFVFLGSSAIALYSLGHVETRERKQPEPLLAEVVKGLSTKNDPANPIPRWLVVAIALSCASGCLIVVRFLNTPAYRPKSRQPSLKDGEDHTIRKYKRQYKKLEPTISQDLPLLTPSSLKQTTPKKVVKNPPVVTTIPPKSKLNPVQSKIKVANMVNMPNMPSKNPLPPLLRKS